MEKHQRVRTYGYDFEFVNEGLEGLRECLNMPGASLPELGLEVFSRIFFSGQYPISEVGDRRLQVEDQFYDLRLRDRRFRSPVDLEGYDFDLMISQIDVEKGNPDTEPMEGLALVTVSGRLEEEEDTDEPVEALSVALHFPREEASPFDTFNPLQRDLKEMLWDTVLRFVLPG